MAAFRRRRDVHIRAERKLAIHTSPSPNQDEDHVPSISAAGSLMVSLVIGLGSVGWAISAYANRILAHWFGC